MARSYVFPHHAKCMILVPKGELNSFQLLACMFLIFYPLICALQHVSATFLISRSLTLLLLSTYAG